MSPNTDIPTPVRLNNRKQFAYMDDDGQIHVNFHMAQERGMLSEHRTVVMLGGAQSGKCGRFSVLRSDGARVFVRDLHLGDNVFCLDESTLKITTSPVTTKFIVGKKETFRLTTTTGRETVVAATHKFYSEKGWVALSELEVGDWVAVPRTLPVEGESGRDLSLSRMSLMGYLLGDGGTTGGSVKFTNVDSAVIEDFHRCLPLSCSTTRHGITYRVRRTEEKRDEKGHLLPSAVADFVDEWGIGCLAKEKRVPPPVFLMSKSGISKMLNALFACDGWVDGKGFGIGLASKGLIQDIQHLLLRFGVLSRFRHKTSTCQTGSYDSWVLDVADYDSLVRLANEIGILGKQEKLLALIEKKKEALGSWNRKDVIPNFPFDKCKSSLAKSPGRGPNPYTAIDTCGQSLLRSHRSNSVSRHDAVIIADHFGFGHDLAHSDIYWDKVLSIVSDGVDEVYDIEVQGHHNFIADDIFSHNSAMGPYWMLKEMQDEVYGGPGEYMVVAPTFPLLDASAIPKMRELFCEWLEIGVERQNPTPQIKITPKGEQFLWGHTQKVSSRVIFGYATKPDSLEARTLKAVWADEPGQDDFKRSSYEALQRRTTTTGGRMLLTTTPYVWNWLKTVLYDKWEAAKDAALANGATEEQARKAHPEIEVIQFKSTLNPNFSEEEYWRQHRSMEFWKWNMFYNGIFTIPAGIIFEMFAKNEKTQVISRLWEKPPVHYPTYLGLDFGGVHTCGVSLAQDPDTSAIYVWNTYFPNAERSVAQHAQALGQINPFYDRVSGGAKSENNWRNDFWAHGIPVEEPEVSDVEVRITRVQGFFARNQVFVFRDQNMLINELFSYQRKTDPESGEPDPKGEIKNKNQYHAIDGLGYILANIASLGYSTSAGMTGERVPQLDDYEKRGEIYQPRTGSVIKPSDPTFNPLSLL